MSRREQPVASRLCTAAWRKRDAESHAERVRRPPTKVDAEPPKTYFLNINRAKRDQHQDEVCDKIDRENQLLLKKMTAIIHTHTLDVVHPSYKRSLNTEQRQRDFNRIVAENNAILNRITVRKAHYDREEWNTHRERHDAYLENCRRDKPIPANPIPLPKFLRDGNLSGRQPHAYLQGNYSPRRATQQSPPPANAVAASGPSYTSGSQSARSSSGPSSTAYLPFSPNRTGTSKTGPAARVHTLQPMPPPKASSSARARSTLPASSSSSTSAPTSLPTVNASISKMILTAAKKAGYSHILTNSRSLGGDVYATLAVHEAPGTAAGSTEEKQETTASTSFLSSVTPIPSGVHALVFRSYDPLENLDRTVSVPFSVVHTLSEVHASPHLLAAANRVELATTLIERLDFHDGHLRFHLGTSPHQRPEDELATDSNAAAAPDAGLPTPATHPIAYTDATGIDYYFDADKNAYAPYPTAVATSA